MKQRHLARRILQHTSLWVDTSKIVDVYLCEWRHFNLTLELRNGDLVNCGVSNAGKKVELYF